MTRDDCSAARSACSWAQRGWLTLIVAAVCLTTSLGCQPGPDGDDLEIDTGPDAGSVSPALDAGPADSGMFCADETGDQPDDVVPIPRADISRAEQLGLYQYRSDPSGYDGCCGANRLKWALDRSRSLIHRADTPGTLRILLKPDAYGLELADYDYAALAEAMEREAGIFSDASFRTYILTVRVHKDRKYRDGMTDDEMCAEKRAIYDLGRYLLSSFPDKRFLLGNWEADNAVDSSGFRSGKAATTQRFEDYARWVEARARGVRRARAEFEGPPRFFSFLEFNLVRWRADQRACNRTDHRCIITAVAPDATVDYYSYSSWQSAPGSVSNAELATRIDKDLTFALNSVRTGRPGFPKRGFFVGEFGAAREVYGGCGSARRTEALIKAFRQWGVATAVYWQVLDNRGGDEASANDLFGAFASPSGNITPAGKTLRSYFDGPGWSCPTGCGGC